MLDDAWKYDPSLVLYLPLQERDARTTDSFMSGDGYGHTCTVTGALWRPDGWYFDGTDDKINIPDHSALDITKAITILAWVFRPSPGGNDFIVAKWTSTRIYSLLESGVSKLIMTVKVGGVSKEAITTEDVPYDRWYLAAGTFDGTTVRAFIDTNYEASLVGAGSIDTSNEPVTIGWGISNTYAWTGRIGEVLIYNRALSPQEIANYYALTKDNYL